MLEGEGFLQIGKALYPVKPGDLFYLPKNILLTYYANPENPYRYYWLGVDGVSAKMLLSKAKLTPQTPVKHYNNDDMVRIFENILKQSFGLHVILSSLFFFQSRL